MKKTINMNELVMNTRRAWAPISRPFKSKKDYNRKDQSWKREV